MGASEKALAFLRDEIREDREDLKTQRPRGDKENKPVKSSKLNDIDPEGWVKSASPAVIILLGHRSSKHDRWPPVENPRRPLYLYEEPYPGSLLEGTHSIHLRALL